MADERSKAIELALSGLEKQFGKGSIMRLGSKDVVPISVISTGSISFDAALGVGGVPRGRVIEIFGPESSGKTTITLQIIAEAQKAGGLAAFVDAEHALDPQYAQKLGVDIDNLLVSQPDYGEQALEIVEALVRSNAIDVLVVDSVAALVPKAELDGEMGDSHMGLQARLMSQALRKLTGTVSKSRTCLIFINQIREKIGVMFGNPETTTGGKALKFYSSVRIDIRRIGAVKDGDNGPMSLDQLDGRRAGTGVCIRLLERLDLPRGRWRVHRLPLAVARAADRADHRVNPVAVAPRVVQPLEHQHAQALAQDRPVGLRVERPGIARRRERRRLAEAHIHKNVIKCIEPAGDGQVAAAGGELERGEVDRAQRAGAGGVDHAVGAAEVEAVGDPAGGDVAEQAGERVFLPADIGRRDPLDDVFGGCLVDAGRLQGRASRSGVRAGRPGGSPARACR